MNEDEGRRENAQQKDRIAQGYNESFLERWQLDEPRLKTVERQGVPRFLILAHQHREASEQSTYLSHR